MRLLVQETPASKRITLIEKEGYVVDLEYGRANGMNFAILHLPVVKRFTKSLYQDMLVKVQEIWEFLSDIHYSELFIAIDPKDKTMGRFVDRLGFIYLGEADGMAVLQYKEYK